MIASLTQDTMRRSQYAIAIIMLSKKRWHLQLQSSRHPKSDGIYRKIVFVHGKRWNTFVKHVLMIVR